MVTRRASAADHRLRATLIQIGCLALLCFWAAVGVTVVRELGAAHAGRTLSAHMHVYPQAGHPQAGDIRHA